VAANLMDPKNPTADPKNEESISSLPPTRVLDKVTQISDDPSRDTVSATRPEEFAYLGPAEGPGELGRLGGYRILRVLGRGGMGVVFEAEDLVLTRRVAIKVPLGLSDDAQRKRFLREARIAATLSNDHIAAIYQAGEQGQAPFLVMELLRGEPLNKRLEREKTLPIGEALRIAREVAEGLREAHAHGLVHRDIKPGNIWLEQRQAFQGPPRVKILDFGLAREISPPKERITLAGHIVGSLGYMAPEQIFAGAVDARTDLFALGCVLYEMLADDLPFTGGGTVDSLKAVIYEQPKPAASVAPHLPASVCRLLDDLLQKEPAARPPNADAVIERIKQIERDLTRQSGALPAAAAPPSPTKPWTRKRTWGAMFGATAIAAAAIVGLIVLIQNMIRPDAEATPKDGPDGGVVTLAGEPIKVGVLFSRTGTLSATEIPVAEATRMAIEEINQAGGVLGRQIEPIFEDGRSTSEGFAAGAEKLIRDKGVAAIFGCWTSASRKAVEPVCAKYDNLLVYPVNYEGLEDSPHVVYVGGGPNQQLLPAASWVVGFKRKRRFFLVGTEQVYSKASNEILRDQMKDLGAEFAGDGYVPLNESSSAKFAPIVAKIKDSKATAVISTVDGYQANIAFFHALAEANVKSTEECPIISFAFFENELRSLNVRDTAGHYAVANYFQVMKNPTNEAFLKRFSEFQPNMVVNDPMATAYSAMYLWKQAVAEAGSARAADVRPALAHQKFEGPEGLIAIDPSTRHAMRKAQIAQVTDQGEFKIVFASPEALPAMPYPTTRTRPQWDEFLLGLYRSWGDRWEGPTR
jgi:urea transport system substrate-binding protein